jgi:DNA-binding transcriptional ArsR family regulator
MRKINAYEAPSWAQKQRFGGDVAAKAIIMLLAAYSDEWATCYPGVDRIAEETELSRSTVLRKLKILAACGLIDVEHRANERGHRTSNRYTLELDVVVTPAKYEKAKEWVSAEHPATTTVLGVNVTPGSPPPPKSHNEREAQVSSGDTGTPRRTPRNPYSPQPKQASIPIEEPPAGAEALLEPCAGDSASEAEIGPEIAFEDFWKVYPRTAGTSKAQARTAFVKAVRSGTPAQVIIDALHMANIRWTLDRTETRFIPHASTWLNQCRWETIEVSPEATDDNPWAGVPQASAIYGQTS